MWQETFLASFSLCSFLVFPHWTLFPAAGGRKALMNPLDATCAAPNGRETKLVASRWKTWSIYQLKSQILVEVETKTEQEKIYIYWLCGQRHNYKCMMMLLCACWWLTRQLFANPTASWSTNMSDILFSASSAARKMLKKKKKSPCSLKTDFSTKLQPQNIYNEMNWQC